MEMKKDYSDFENYCGGESQKSFSNKSFGLRISSVTNLMSKTKNKDHFTY